MNADLLMSTCRLETRKAFDEFKRQIEVCLFTFNEDLKENLQLQMLEQLGMGVIKTMYKGEISEQQLRIITHTINNYKGLALKTSDNYAKKML